VKPLESYDFRSLQKAGAPVTKGPKPLAKASSNPAPFAFAELLHSIRAPEAQKMAPASRERFEMPPSIRFQGRAGMGAFKPMAAARFVNHQNAEAANFTRIQMQPFSAPPMAAKASGGLPSKTLEADLRSGDQVRDSRMSEPEKARAITVPANPAKMDSSIKFAPIPAADISRMNNIDQEQKTKATRVLSEKLSSQPKTSNHDSAELPLATPAPSSTFRDAHLADAKRFNLSSGWKESPTIGMGREFHELQTRAKGEVAAAIQASYSAKSLSRPLSRVAAPLEKMIPWLNREAKVVCQRDQQRVAEPVQNETARRLSQASDSKMAAAPGALESQTKGKKVAPELSSNGAAPVQSAVAEKNSSKANFTTGAALEKMLPLLNREAHAARPAIQSQGTATATRIEYLRNLSHLAEKIQASAQLRNGSARVLEIHLTPPRLGSVVLRVETEGQEMRLHFGAQSEAAMQMLKDLRSDLANVVSEQGYDLKRCDVEHQAMHDHRPPAAGAGWTDRQHPSPHLAVPSSTPKPSLEDEWVQESAPRLDFGYNTLDLVA